jgi:23S rRNA (pseudouridine1915-N3)-methyltransferase
MIKINIISVGKLKEQYWREAEAEYLKRLSVWIKINITELKEESFTPKDKTEIIKKKEADKIRSVLPKNSFLVILDPNGKQFNSLELASKINELSIYGVNEITIVIGGPLGLDKSIIDSADVVLSLSKLTFTHQMSRIILLEQLYRSFTIINNKKYHY